MKKIISIAVGTAIAATITSGLANAVENPFGMTPLENGYRVAMSSVPEGSCGSKDSEGKCGEKKQNEGMCGQSRCGGT